MKPCSMRTEAPRAVAPAGHAGWPLMATAPASTPATWTWAPPMTTAGPHIVTNHNRKEHHMPNTKSSTCPNSDTESSPCSMKGRVINYIRAGYAGLYLVSPEEQRVESELKEIAQEVGFNLYVWSTTTGLIDTDKGSGRQVNDPMEALLAITELPEKTITILRDFHLFLNGDPNPLLLRQLKDALQHAKTRNTPLILLGCRLCLPPELEREITVEFAL